MDEPFKNGVNCNMYVMKLQHTSFIYIGYIPFFRFDLEFCMQIPTNGAGLIEYRSHPFWNQKYCPKHEKDGTPRCCSCDRIQVSIYSNYLTLAKSAMPCSLPSLTAALVGHS
jgi:hypothetical protein